MKTKKKTKTLQEQHNYAWNNKNEVSRHTWAFYWWRRGCLGHPQALTLLPLGYFLGWHRGGIPKLELLSILHLITSFSLYTWKFSFIQNFTQSSLATLVYSKDNRPLGLALEQQNFSLKRKATVATPSKISIPKRELKKESIRSKCK